MLIGLRIAGIAMVSLASFAWRTDRGGRELVRIGMVALILAEVAAAADKSSTAVDLARIVGSLGIGASLLAVSTRVISARIAATGAMLVLAVITVVAVTLSAVISNNIEQEAVRRYEARAKAGGARGRGDHGPGVAARSPPGRCARLNDEILR